MSKHILECENCHGNVEFAINGNLGAVTGLAGVALGGLVLGPVGAVLGLAGGLKASTSGGGICQQCGAKYKKDAINLLREKATFTLPPTPKAPRPKKVTVVPQANSTRELLNGDGWLS